MTNRVIEVEADSLESARAEVRSKVPPDQVVLNERVISDGKPQTVRKCAETTAEALKLACQQVPAGARVIEEKKLTDAQSKTLTVEVFTEQKIPAEIERLLGAEGIIKAKRLVTAARNGFLGIGKRPAVFEVEVFLPAQASVTWKTQAKIAAEIGEKPKHRFDPYLGSGVCDVCNNTLTSGRAYKVPVDTFYNSPAYRNHCKPLAMMVGANIDIYIANMRSMDKTTHSAVCESCVHMFE